MDLGSAPRHVLLIPDANRRWADARGLPRAEAYRESGNYANLKSLLTHAKDLGVGHFTIWGFSTDNWARPDEERRAIFSQIALDIDSFFSDLQSGRIRFYWLGRRDRLPEDLSQKLISLEGRTRAHDEFFVYLCVDYSGQDEIIRASRKIALAVKEGRIEADDINEQTYSQFEDVPTMPSIDLAIRTGGEWRLSNCPLWQIAHAALYFTNKKFPEFHKSDLDAAVAWYRQQKRSYGA